MIWNILILSFIPTFCVEPSNGMSEDEGMRYVKHYGHNSMADFQKAYKLNITGKMDNATESMMQMKRCGGGDTMKMQTNKFSIQGSIWRIRNITYKIIYPDKIKPDLVSKAITGAYEEWSKYSNFNFTEVDSEALLNISFVPLNKTEIAIAYYPIFGGNINFNSHLTWSNDYTSTNLPQVALHEIGHSLGLGHSMDINSIMYPYYNDSMPKMRLNDSDIEGIKTLYQQEIEE